MGVGTHGYDRLYHELGLAAENADCFDKGKEPPAVALTQHLAPLVFVLLHLFWPTCRVAPPLIQLRIAESAPRQHQLQVINQQFHAPKHRQATAAIHRDLSRCRHAGSGPSKGPQLVSDYVVPRVDAQLMMERNRR